MKNLFCFGHRGAGGHAPENTLVGFEKAIELGADGIELDVRFADGTLIVFHDERLERTTNGSGYVDEKTLEELKALDIVGGQRIPTLAEAIDLIDRRVVVNVELKGPNTAEPTARLLGEYIDHHGWQIEQFLVSSFDYPQLEQIKAADDRFRIAPLICGVPLDLAACGQRMGAYSIHPKLDFVNEALVRDAQRRGLKVFVFTVNHPQDVARVRALRVDGVFSDFPGLVG